MTKREKFRAYVRENSTGFCGALVMVVLFFLLIAWVFRLPKLPTVGVGVGIYLLLSLRALLRALKSVPEED